MCVCVRACICIDLEYILHSTQYFIIPRSNLDSNYTISDNLAIHSVSQSFSYFKCYMITKMNVNNLLMKRYNLLYGC